MGRSPEFRGAKKIILINYCVCTLHCRLERHDTKSNKEGQKHLPRANGSEMWTCVIIRCSEKKWVITLFVIFSFNGFKAFDVICSYF